MNRREFIKTSALPVGSVGRAVLFPDRGYPKVVKDFLPPPDQLILKEETVKLTISLNKSSVDLFKKVAKENKTQYQKMIRKLIGLLRFPISTLIPDFK